MVLYQTIRKPFESRNILRNVFFYSTTVVNFSQGILTSAPSLMIASTCINNGKSSKDTMPLSASLRTARAVLVAITMDSNVTPCNSSIA